MKWGSTGTIPAFSGRRDMPQVVRPTKPELEDDCFIYLSAFYDLSTCRQIGGEIVGDIPFTAIVKWLEYYNINNEDSEFYLDIIPRLDRIYLNHVYKKREESLDRAGRGSGGSKRAGIGAKTSRKTRR